jgi:hypothetical protein
MGRKKIGWDERGGFDKCVLRLSDSRCILRTGKEPKAANQRTTKADVFANEPIRTGGVGNTLNNGGYGGDVACSPETRPV